MNKQLEEYVETVAARLKTLPEAEKEQQIAELRQHLESLVAANQAEGESEEIATEAALQQFGSAQEIGSDLGRSVWRMRLKRLPEPVVTVLSVTAATAISTLFFQYGIGPLIGIVVPPLPPLNGLSTNSVTITYNALLTPSFVLGVAALGLLLYRDGAARTIRGFLNLQTVAAAALLWLILSRIGGSIVSLSLAHALVANHLWDMETLQLISPVFGSVPAAVAAWIVTRTAPRSGMKGIASTILVGTLLALVQIAGNSGQMGLPLAPVLQNYSIAIIPLIAAAMAFAGLATVQNRRQRHARAA